MSNGNIVLARNTERVPKRPPAAQTVALSHYNHLSAQSPIEPTSGQSVGGGIRSQATQCLKNIQAAVESISHVMSDIVRTTIFAKDMRGVAAVEEVYAVFFTHYYPVKTVVAVADLPLGTSVQTEILVSNGEGTIPNASQAGDLIKLTNQAVQAPTDALASQTVAFSHYNNLSVQLSIDFQTGRVVAGRAKTQTKQCLKNIKAILTSIDVPFDDIAKINIYLKDLSRLEAVSQIYAAFFPNLGIARTVNYISARTAVTVVNLSMSVAVQVEAVASRRDGTPSQAIGDRHGLTIGANNTDHAPKCPFPTQTVAFSHYNHLLAQLSLDPRINALVAGRTKEQTMQCLENIRATIESADHSLADLVKTNISAKEIEELAAIGDVYQTYFPEGTPARRVIGVTGSPKGVQIQIEAIAGNTEGTPPIG